ncbi:MAG: hypothetical protein WAN75_47985 [Xanthobacteraceae bacterium]
MRKMLHNLPARLPGNAPEKPGCLRNKTPDLTLTDVKTRQASKIREIGEALITAGFVSLDAQAKVFELPRSTAWTILSTKHKGPGISARTICRMLSSKRLPPFVRAKIMEYAEEELPVFTVVRRRRTADLPRNSN